MQSRPDPLDLTTARTEYQAAAGRVDSAVTAAKMARHGGDYPAAVTALLEAQRAQVQAHRRLRAATAGHRVDPAALARLDQDGAALDQQLDQVVAEHRRLHP